MICLFPFYSKSDFAVLICPHPSNIAWFLIAFFYELGYFLYFSLHFRTNFYILEYIYKCMYVHVCTKYLILSRCCSQTSVAEVKHCPLMVLLGWRRN